MGGQGSSSLVGRIVDSVNGATTAAADGADLVLVTVSQHENLRLGRLGLVGRIFDSVEVATTAAAAWCFLAM